MSTKCLPSAPAPYERLAAELRNQLLSGAIQPGERLPSFVQMRRRGLSQHTVEKSYGLLERDGLISRSGGSGVYACPKGLKPRSATIGILGAVRSGHQPMGAHLYAMEVLSGVGAAAESHQATVMLLGENSTDAAWEKVDGVLLYAKPQSQSTALPPGMITVNLLSHCNSSPAVLADDRQGARDATLHLLGLGHRRIAFLTAATDSWSALRLQGYRDALEQYGLTIDPELLRSIYGAYLERPFDFFQEGRDRIREWMKDGWQDLGVTAVLAQNDQAALGVMAALKEAGIGVPEQVSVVGFDGTEASQYFEPQLTTVSVPLREIGFRGAQLLLNLLDHGAPSTSGEMLATQLVIGGSSGPLQNL